MKVYRKGKIIEVDEAKTRVGDVYIGKCTTCHQPCQCEELSNGYIKHSPLHPLLYHLGIFSENTKKETNGKRTGKSTKPN
jgi:hypothetical protein